MIEDINLKSTLLTALEVCQNIPNDKIPIIFVTDFKIESIDGYATICISTLKNEIIKRFIYKALRCGDLSFQEDEISVYLTDLVTTPIKKGSTRRHSIYKNNPKNIEIDKKCLTNVVGRIEEQSSIAIKLLNIRKSNKFLNVKASGGTGKTTLIKKVAYELYNRGYFTEGITFKSCESIKSTGDFEELLIAGFNLTNILKFKEYLIENYSLQKKDLLIILDNFETVSNTLNINEMSHVIDMIKFASDYANIALTSRERINLAEDFEDVFSLTSLTTDDAFSLFINNYGEIKDDEIPILRSEILEELLNNNPLAIKLVTKSRTRFKYIKELKLQLSEHFFESTNDHYINVYKANADLNIERTRSLFQSINYSYATLTTTEKLALELLSLFPDGISLSSFKKCFPKGHSLNKISDNDLRTLRNKSLLEDDNGILQLQPIIRRFAEHQFSLRNKETTRKYCLDAYVFNCYILDILQFITRKKSISDGIKAYTNHKNNLLNVLSYIPDLQISARGPVRKKEYLINYIYLLSFYIINEKQINEYKTKIDNLRSFFSDLPNAELLIRTLEYKTDYYHKEFNYSYKKLSELLSVHDMEYSKVNQEDYIEYRYKYIISSIHSMEGYTIQYIKSLIANNIKDHFLISDFFYLGIPNHISEKDKGFYYYEYELMFNQLNLSQLEHYINSLYQDEHLEKMQCTYTLSKVKTIEITKIQKFVVTNPYTLGLKKLMLAFSTEQAKEKITLFESALSNLYHIKYYYLEALYYYCLFLKHTNLVDFSIKVEEGLELSKKFFYQYTYFLFSNIEKDLKPTYSFTYSFYPCKEIEGFVEEHNKEWGKIFKENEIE